MDHHYEFNKSRIIERDAALREQRYAFLSSLISVMEPSEVVGLYRRESEAQSRLADELFDTVGFLFEHDVPQACSIVSCMAESVNSKDREDAAGTLDTLTPVAPRLGFHLWGRLIRDEDPKVRGRAYDLIKEYISESDEGSNSGPLVDKLRLTWQDAYQLVHGYSEAESGRNRHQVGNVAVSGAVDRPRNP